MNSRLYGRRAIAAIVTASMLSTGTAVLAPSAAVAAENTKPAKPAAKGPKGSPEGMGQGTLSVKESKVDAGDTITVEGKGFKPALGEASTLNFKLNDGNIPFPDEQPQLEDDYEVTGGFITVTGKHLQDADGNFSVELALPDDLKDGEYWVRLLASPADLGEAVSKYALFTVGEPAEATEAEKPAEEAKPSEDAKPSETDSEDAAESEAEVTAEDATTAPTGEVSIPVKASGFKPGATLKATVGDKDAGFREGRATKDTATADDKGAFEGTIVAPAGVAPAGEESEFTIGDDKDSATGTVTAQPGVDFKNGEVQDTSQGATVKATITNLPAGAKVTAVGSEDENWAKGEASADDAGKAEAEVEIPEDAKVGTPLVVTVGDKAFETSATVTPSNQTSGVEHFDSKIAKLPQGLYQSAYSANENALYVTSTVGRPPIKESTLYKLDADTLEVKAKINPEKDGEFVANAVYGVDVDDELGYVWVTNTRSSSVAIYDAKDLSLVHQFDRDVAGHARDVQVDEKTHKAYVSVPVGDETLIEIFDGKTKSKEGTIKLPSEFGGAMSLDLDQETGTLYVAARDAAKAAAVDTRGDKTAVIYDLPEDAIKGATGVAFDSKNKTLWVTSSNSAKAVAFDVKKQEVVAFEDAGAGALNAAYDPVHELVYVVNRLGGTVTVFDANTHKRVANLNTVGMFANHVITDGRGNAYAVNKFPEPSKDLELTNRVVKITPAEEDSVDETKPSEGNKPEDQKPEADKPAEDKPEADKPEADKPSESKPSQGSSQVNVPAIAGGLKAIIKGAFDAVNRSLNVVFNINLTAAFNFDWLQRLVRSLFSI